VLQAKPHESKDDEPGNAEDEAGISKFKNSLIISDDYSAFSSKSIQKAIKNFHEKLLHLARQDHIDLIFTVHDAMAYQKTKKQLVDMSRLAVFPGASNWSQIEKVAQNYAGLGKRDLARLKEIGKRQRWPAIISTTAPSYILFANECILCE